MGGKITDLEVNGIAHSWESSKLTFDGDEFNQFSSIDFDDKLESAFAYGSGKSHGPIARSGGKYTPGVVKLTALKGAMQQFREWVAAKSPNGKSYGKVIFQGVFQYLGDDDVPIKIEFRNLKWVSNTSGDKEGADPLTDSCELQPMRILRNGIALYDNTDEV
jgi:hypothetical protein